MTDKQIQSTWQYAGNSFTTGNNPDNFNPEKKTALDRLAERYRRFYTVGLIMAPCSILIYGNSEIFPDLADRWIVGSVFAAYFFICFVLDHYLYRKIKSVDLYRMTVKQVSIQALKLKKFHLKCVMLLIPVALLLLGYLLWATGVDQYFKMGICAGAILGICIGYIQFRRFMAEYRTLIDASDFDV